MSVFALFPLFSPKRKGDELCEVGKAASQSRKKLSKFATWTPKEEGRKEGGREGHYTATIHPTHRREDGRKETQFSTKQMSSFLRRRGEVTTLGANGRGLSSSIPRGHKWQPDTPALNPFPMKSFFLPPSFPLPLSRALSACPSLHFGICPV